MLNNFKKNILHVLFVTVTLGVLYYTVQHTPLLQHIVQTDARGINAASYACLKEQIAQEEQNTWDLLETNTRVTKDECFKKQQQDYPNYLKSLNRRWNNKNNVQLKPETIALVEEVLCDFGINPQDVKIVPYKGQGSPAAATDGNILIDEKEFNHYSPEACRFFIAHEIAHMQVQDDSVYEALHLLAQRKKAPYKKRKKAMDAFRRFQETRADMHALLHGGSKYAQGAFDFLGKLYELDGGDNPGITHPKTTKRIETAEKICSMMGWNAGPIQA